MVDVEEGVIGLNKVKGDCNKTGTLFFIILFFI